MEKTARLEGTKFLGIDITATKELDANQIILKSGKEKMIVSVDPAGMEPPQYILSRLDSRGLMTVVEYGELTAQGIKRKGGKRG